MISLCFTAYGYCHAWKKYMYNVHMYILNVFWYELNNFCILFADLNIIPKGIRVSQQRGMFTKTDNILSY